MKLTLAFVFCLVVASTSALNIGAAFKELKGITSIKNLAPTTAQVERVIVDTGKKFEQTIGDIVTKVKARIGKTDKSIINKNPSLITKLAADVATDARKCITQFASDLTSGLSKIVKRAVETKATSINIADLKIPTVESAALACIKKYQDQVHAALDKLHVYRI